MANLTEISIGARKFLKYLGLAFAAFMILRFLIFVGIAYWKATHLPPPAPPDLAFGVLPPIKFSDNAITTAGMTFTLQNIEGKPPETTSSARIYQMPKKTYTFESGDKVKELSGKFGFETEPTIDTVYYTYRNHNNPLLTLFVDGINLNFHLKYDYLNDPDIFLVGQIKSEEEGVKNVKNYLSYSNAVDETIINGETTTQELIYDGELRKFVPASSLSTAHALRVNFFRKDLNEMKLLPDDFDMSYNYAIYTPNLKKYIGDFLEISYIFYPIDLATSGTYPLISGEVAYQQLTEGKAVIVRKGNNSDSITIRKIYLAYFDTSIPQQYLQPIFVFEGENGFVAYLPAVRPEPTEASEQ